MNIEPDIFDYLETTSLEPHDDYTSEITYKDQKIIWNRLKQLQQELDHSKNNWEELKEHLEAMIRIYENEYKSVDDAEHYRSVLNKMKELEEDK